MTKKDYANWGKTELVKEINKLEKRKKYGIVWEDKPEKVADLCKEKLPILEEDTKKEIKTDDKKPINILIEGDNYHALSVLNYTHKGKVDVIYIDPPYNTGSKDWKYNNDYVDINDQWRHSKWLSFMEKRIKLAKNLLRNNGIIIIAIDDYELFTLGLIADEIFLEKNRIGIIPVRNNPPGRAISKYFATSHEYYLFYAKNKNNVKISNIPTQDNGDFKFKDNISVYRRKSLSMRGHGSIKDRPHNYYPIYINLDSSKVSLEKMPNSLEVFPHKGKDGKQRVWDYPRESMQNFIEKNDIEFVIGKDKKVSIYKKDRPERGMRPKSLWLDAKYDSSVYGAVLLKKMFDNKRIFDYPKSLYAVMDAISVSSDNKKNIIVLDFFAGSGTTGQAVLELNNKDDGKRTFILCTNNENNNGNGLGIAEGVCYPRIEKVIKGYNGNKGIDGNLKYFKTDFVDAEPTDKNKRKMVAKSTEMLCLKEECFEEVKKGTDFKIFKNSQDKHLGIIYDDDGIEPFKKEVKKLNKQFVVYVFSLDESAREEEFEDMNGNVELRPIPAVILNVYKRIFK